MLTNSNHDHLISISPRPNQTTRVHFRKSCRCPGHWQWTTICFMALFTTVSWLWCSQVHAQGQKLVDEVEQNAQRLIDGYFDAVDRANRTANPLQAKEPNREEFERNIKNVLDGLVGRDITVSATVAGFKQEGDRVFVSFMDGPWLENTLENFRFLRYRLNSDLALDLAYTNVNPTEFAPEDMARFYQGMMSQIFRPYMKQLSPVSVLGEVGVHVERFVAQDFDLGSKYPCPLRIKGYTLSWKSDESVNQNPFGLFGLGAENPDLMQLGQLLTKPYVEIHCEWSRSVGDVKLGDLDATLKSNPRDSEAYAARGELWHERKEFQKALADFDRAIALDPESSAYLLLRGHSKYSLNDFQAAANDYQSSVELEPRVHEALNCLAKALMKLSDFKKAIENLNRAIELGPKQVEYVGLRGMAKFMDHRLEDAVADFSEYLEHRPDHSEILTFRGWAKLKMGNYDDATKDFQSSLEQNENLMIGHLGFALLQSSSPRSQDRDGKAALARIQPYLNGTAGHDSTHLDLMAAVLAEVGQFDKAVELMTMAIERVDQDPYYRTHQEELWDRLALYQSRQPYRLRSAANINTKEDAVTVKTKAESAVEAPLTNSAQPATSNSKPFLIGKWKQNVKSIEQELRRRYADMGAPVDNVDMMIDALNEMKFTFEEDGTVLMTVSIMGTFHEEYGTWKVVERKDANTLMVVVDLENSSKSDEPGQIRLLSNGNLALLMPDELLGDLEVIFEPIK